MEILKFKKIFASGAMLASSLGLIACENTKDSSNESATITNNESNCTSWSVNFSKDVGNGEIRTAEIKTDDQYDSNSRISISWIKGMPDQLVIDTQGQENGIQSSELNPPEAILNEAIPSVNVQTEKKCIHI